MDKVGNNFNNFVLKNILDIWVLGIGQQGMTELVCQMNKIDIYFKFKQQHG